ncbi:MAG: hypothetical protein HUU35_03590 [Armatimonadetes bacterium]|nr:hypothetical protein [Armatimonadota bacterium]
MDQRWRRARTRVQIGVERDGTDLAWRLMSSLALMGFILQIILGWFSVRSTHASNVQEPARDPICILRGERAISRPPEPPLLPPIATPPPPFVKPLDHPIGHPPAGPHPRGGHGH